MPGVAAVSLVDPAAESQQELRRRDLLAIYIFASTAVGFALSSVWKNHVVPRIFFREERQLAADVVRLTKEADSHIQVDQLHRQSQVRRRIITVKRRLTQLQTRRHALTLHFRHIVLLRAPTADPVTAPPPGPSTTATERSEPSSGSPNPTGTVPTPTTPRTHGTRSAVLTRDQVAPAPHSCAFWCEVLYYSLPGYVYHMLRLGTLFVALRIAGNMPALVSLPRDALACFIGQLSPIFMLTHVLDFIMVGPLALQHTSYVLHETDELTYEATRQLRSRNSHVGKEEITQLLSMRAGNPFASVLCWYVLCVIVVLFARRVMA